MTTRGKDNRYKELADFLKTRRQNISPEQVGLPKISNRRTPGLRREEVAQLSGVGLTWYTWLEQGRPIHVSASIVESLSRALLLDNSERKHLYLLANQPFPCDLVGSENPIRPALLHFVESQMFCPSFITDLRWNIIKWNYAADLVFTNLAQTNAKERNIVRMIFTDQDYKKLSIDWSTNAKRLLANFRASCGEYIDDPWLTSFIEDLQRRSPDFLEWWSLHEIDDSHEIYNKLNHPTVGKLEFEVNNFTITDDPALRLIIHVPSPQTDTAAKMRLLLKS
ncbi:MAG: helix-turn-helix transcriptional regulator [Anaerolineaceae bacterium]|nr:helix-turn-helix transcriptional regulator [Anaerolineaceae bacterium]